MSESPTENLNDVIFRTLSNFMAECDNPGMVTGFVMAVEAVMGDGSQAVFTAFPTTQPPHRGLGLAGYLDAWFRDDINTSFYPCPLDGLEE